MSEVEIELGIKYYVVQIDSELIEREHEIFEWVEEYDAYFKRDQDTNMSWVEFQSGYYLGGDIYTVYYCFVYWDNIYRVTFTMTDNDPDTIMFLSNVQIS